MACDIDDREGESPSPLEPRLGGCSAARRPVAAVDVFSRRRSVFVNRITLADLAIPAGDVCVEFPSVLALVAARRGAAIIPQLGTGTGPRDRLCPAASRRTAYRRLVSRPARTGHRHRPRHPRPGRPGTTASTLTTQGIPRLRSAKSRLAFPASDLAVPSAVTPAPAGSSRPPINDRAG
jgi:hypothetical protein